jgi:hypothetical protein
MAALGWHHSDLIIEARISFCTQDFSDELGRSLKDYVYERSLS